MTPKEKAEELYSKYYNRIEHCLSEDYYGSEKFIIQQCALIVVDEVLLETDDNYDSLHASDRRIYWQNVKQEIEKL